MKDKQMPGCKEYSMQLMLYLDGELDSNEKSSFEAHLKVCHTCRQAFNQERWFLECLQRTSPLYIAPTNLRHKVAVIIDQTSLSSRADSGLQSRKLFSWFSRFPSSVNRRAIAAVVTSLLLLVGLWGIVQILNPTQSMSFAMVAVDNHLRHKQGRLPLELVSDVPEEISNWFQDKLAFSMKLPSYQESPNQHDVYALEGARLVSFKNDYAAYVAYQMRQNPISLVITSSENTELSDGKKIISKGITFYYQTISGFKVITWSHHGLTYALVSELEKHGQRPCLICHQGTKNSDIIGHLKLSDKL